MTINQALKEKNRLVGKLRNVDNKIQKSAKWVKGNEPPYSLSDLFDERTAIRQDLVNLKTAISYATSPIVGKIILLAEVKGELTMYKSLDVAKGLIHDRYSSTAPIEYESALNQKDLDSLIESCETKISTLQDELDKFNATTDIPL